ncbi:MAG: hypothetical protein DRJ50_09265 [Actinobacteria bacterium]|nr:MAG: hypothetical protein DRJ50_09265 [Actinomycetota bacterium]
MPLRDWPKKFGRRFGKRANDAVASPVRFSIVLPLYNSPLEHLKTQLESISAQSHKSWECIVVDDGSADTRGVELAEQMSVADPRFAVHRRPVNGGIAAATNDGLDRATGDWIVFCDHDDVLYPHALETVAAHIATHPEDDFIYSDEELIDEDGALIHQHNKPDFSPERFLANNYLCHLVSVRHSLVDNVGRLVTEYEPSADRDFNMRAASEARHVGHIPQILYGWRAIRGSVAKAITEKPNVAESVLVTAQAHLDRLGESGTASILPGGEAMVCITWPTVDDDVERITLDESTTASEINQIFENSSARFVVLWPASVDLADADWLSALTAQCARPNVGAAGPLLATTDNRLISAGRVHHPSAHDLFQGINADNHGPWGAFLVSREVASVSPLGAVFDRRAVLDVGGFDIDALVARAAPGPMGNIYSVAADYSGSADALVDITTSILCTALRLARHSTVWTPQSKLMLPPSSLLSDAQLEERVALHKMVADVFPRADEDPYSPIGVHRI